LFSHPVFFYVFAGIQREIHDLAVVSPLDM